MRKQMTLRSETFQGDERSINVPSNATVLLRLHVLTKSRCISQNTRLKETVTEIQTQIGSRKKKA